MRIHGYPIRVAWIQSLLTILLAFSAPSLALVPVPELTGRVVDLTGTLSGPEKSALEHKLRAFEERKGSQVAVLIVPTTAPEALEQYSIRVVDKWKLGRKKEDDGALLLVAKDDRQTRIEVGYGLEGALPDLTAKRIIEDIMLPRFRAGDFSGGIDRGVDAMLKVIDGEPLPAPERRRGGAAPLNGFSVGLLVIVVIFGSLLRLALGRMLGASVSGGLAVLGSWLFLGSLGLGLLMGLMAFFFVLFGGMGGHGFGRRGLGGGGGFRGGGLGGFSGGGGGFGGGGASGRW